MNDIDIIITCMGRLEHLKQSLPLALSQKHANCIVVDYSCPERCGEWIENNGLTAQVVRVPGQKHFNASHARNSGAAAGNAPWIFFLDADMLLDTQAIKTIHPLLTSNSLFLFEILDPGSGVMGSCLCKREAFEKIGGYDEIFRGWGREDEDLYARLQLQGADRQYLPGNLISPIWHDDTLRTCHHELKDKTTNRLINWMYGKAKLDLLKIRDGAVDKNQRLDLYRAIQGIVSQAGVTGNGELLVSLEKQQLWGMELQRSYRCRIQQIPETESSPSETQTADSSGTAPPSFQETLRKLHERWPDLISDSTERPLFLLSSGFRSGSTLLQRILFREDWIWGEPFGPSGLFENLSQTIRALSSEWLWDDFLEDDIRFEKEKAATWIANLYPHPRHLLNATRNYLESLFAVPAKARGHSLWGVKETRLDADMALFLKWLYPDCRLLFLVRNPYHAYRSYRRFPKPWYTHWPHQRLDTPERFGTHWLRLTQSFHQQAENLGALLLRYEQLLDPQFDWSPVEAHIGHPVDMGALEHRITGHAKNDPSDPTTLMEELVRLSNIVGSYATSLGYWLPAPSDLRQSNAG